MSAPRLNSPGAGQFELLGELAPLAGVGIGVILMALIDNFTSRITPEQDVQCTVLLARAENDEVLSVPVAVAGLKSTLELQKTLREAAIEHLPNTLAQKYHDVAKQELDIATRAEALLKGEPESEEFTARLLGLIDVIELHAKTFYALPDPVSELSEYRASLDNQHQSSEPFERAHALITELLSSKGVTVKPYELKRVPLDNVPGMRKALERDGGFTMTS